MGFHSARGRLAGALCGLAAVIGLLAAGAAGDDRFWSSPGGGWFEDPGNWGGAPPPGAADNAIFDLVSPGYVVAFAASPTSGRLTVHYDEVTLDLNGQTWTLADAFESVVAGSQPGDVASLSVTDGFLNGSQMLIAEDPWAIGTVSVQSGGTVTLSGAAEVGRLGDGWLEIVDGGVVGCGAVRVAGDRDPLTGRGSVGYLTVSQEGSHLDCGGQLLLGGYGEGYAMVSQGGKGDVAGNVVIAQQAASDAYLVVSDANSWLEVDLSVTVGQGGCGSMSVLDGGKVTSAGGTVGADGGAEGTVEVSAEGAAWVLTGALTVGESGRGMMIVSDGGQVTGATEGVVGRNAHGEGLVKVTDANSLWSVGGYLTIGLEADSAGRLRIENGGAAVCGETSVAYLGGYGEVVVTGTDSNWHGTGSLYLGDGGTGELHVLDEGQVLTDGFVVLGQTGGASGSATVRGAGSHWQVGGGLYVGGGGTGGLTLDQRAGVSCGSAVVGWSSGSTGTVTVSGPGTLLDVTWNLHVGDAGDGNLAVSDGAQVYCDSLVIGASAGGSGVLTVSGADSLVQVDYQVEVGKNGSSGVLRVEDGGQVDAWSVLGITAYADGKLDLAGGTILAGTCTLDGGGLVGHGTLDADVAGDPNIIARGGVLRIGTGGVAYTSFSNPGMTRVESEATLELDWADPAALPGTTTLDNGVLIARNGVDLGGGLLAGYGVVVGDVLNGSLPIAAAPTGTVNLTVPLDVGDGNADVYSAGTADLGVETTLAGGLLRSDQALRLGSGDTLRGWGSVYADVTLNNGVLDAEEGGWISVVGTVSGYGVLVGAVEVDPVNLLIDSPTGTVALDGELHVGGREAEVFSVGPARLGPLTTLDGGAIEARNGLVLPAGAMLTGAGWVDANFHGEEGSAVIATGDLDIGDAFSPQGFRTDGVLEVGAGTVMLNSFGPVRLGSLTVLGGGTLAALNCIEMPSGAQLRGAGTVAGSLAIENALIQAAAGESIDITQSLTGYGIVVGEVTARNLGIASFPSGTVQWDGVQLTLGAQTGHVYSAGRAELGASIDMGGGTLHAANGIDFSWGGLYGFGTIDGAVSGFIHARAEGGTLTIGDATRPDGIDFTEGGIDVDWGATLELLDADEAVLNVEWIYLDGGVLIARNGAVLGSQTELYGHGVVVGEVVGGLQTIHNPDFPLELNAPLDVGGERAVVFSAGQAALSDTHLAGGELVAVSGVRFEDSKLSGHGTVNADVELANAVISADEGETIEITGDLSGYGVVVGQVSADSWSIQNPTGTVKLDGDLDVGARTATFYSAGPAQCGGAITLAGGVIHAPAAGLGLDHGGSLVGFGTVGGPLHGMPGSLISASGGDLVLGSGGFAGFHTDGMLDVGGHTVTIQSASVSNLGAWTELAGGALNAPGGVAIRAGDGLYGFGAVHARVFAAAGSRIEADGPLTLGDDNALDGFRSDGSLQVGSHSVTLRDKNQAVLAALTTLGDGGGGTLSAPNGMLLENGKDLTGHGDVHGDFENQGYVLGEGLGLTFHDHVTGSGEFDGNVAFAGTYSPGSSPAVANFGGNVTFLGTAELVIELADTNNADPYNPSYDSLDVAGDVVLGGTLSLEWLYAAGDANSAFGGVYTILAYGGARTEAFDGVAGELAAYLDDSEFADGIEYDDAAGEVKVHLYDLLAGDADLDGAVGRDDFLAMEAGSALADATWFDGDFDFDGVVSAADYLIWKAHVGQSVSEAVPEPATLVLLVPAALVALTRRRRS